MRKVLAIVLSLIMILSTVALVASAQENKISLDLQEKLNNSKPDDEIGIYICFYGAFPNATEMPSWPDMETARKELDEYYDNWYNNEIMPVVFKDIDYKEIFVNSGLVIVSVKVCDISKICECDMVRNILYFENRKLENMTNDANKSDYLYEKNYNDYFSMTKDYYYDELYYHTDVNDEIDWVLINAHSLMGSSLVIQMNIDDLVITSPALYNNFKFGYGIYDVKEDTFYDLFELSGNPKKYEGLTEKLEELMIGRMIGDCDNDRKISVMDATKIQRCLAGLDRFKHDDYFSVYETTETGRFSDMDRDGEVTVMDATAIQMKLAKFDTNLALKHKK